KASLQELLGVKDLTGMRFLDIGSGSGLFSLAAIELNAKEVYSFDYDQNSVDCAKSLRAKYEVPETRWRIERGSVLDADYIQQLPMSDVVYSWGVLHHTGAMWKALELAATRVMSGGILAIAIYNDQGWQSKLWTAVKRYYNRGVLFQIPLIIFFQLLFGAIGLVADLAVYRRSPLIRYRNYESSARGMNRFTDLLDWLGGYPFEVAKPEEIFHFYQKRGFELTNLRTVGGGHACNEFVFTRVANIVD
ncbi:MAG: class I SAM-dependent methyltransferase, partial [Bdellovibrionales bacterium]|nr:class I SAM-dependent methyltransferase [Bdellovibrionales bacterium]